MIDPERLLRHLDDPNWAVLDCRFDLADSGLGERLYRSAHVPGAMYLHLEHDLSSPPDGVNGRHPLPDDARLEKVFSRCGIEPGVQVVAYDAQDGGYAGRLWWLLRYAGHPEAAVLDGGFNAWEAAGYPVKSGPEARQAREFHIDPQPQMIASAAEVEAARTSSACILIDSRAPERFRGEIEPIDRVAGHIPGAVNHCWQDNLLPSGKLVPPDRLVQQFNLLLAGKSADHAIVYCGSGVTACQNILSMEHSGFTGARLYPGSWSGWICDPDRPIATGP